VVSFNPQSLQNSWSKKYRTAMPLMTDVILLDERRTMRLEWERAGERNLREGTATG